MMNAYAKMVAAFGEPDYEMGWCEEHQEWEVMDSCGGVYFGSSELIEAEKYAHELTVGNDFISMQVGDDDGDSIRVYYWVLS